MKEFLNMLKRFDLKGLFLSPTNNSFIQFFRYVFVGGVATVVDWGVLFLLTEYLNVYHLVSAVFAFVAGLITNFVLSKQFVFNANVAKTTPVMEFIAYALIGVMGLGLTEAIMFGCTDLLSWHYMLSKVIATVLVLAWNYLSRKLFLYKK